MKSSVAVFSNQGDPFPAQTGTRTHYRPSAPQTLTEEQKQTVLSPGRLQLLPHHLSDALSPPDLSFLVGSQCLVPGPPESDSSEPFDESWPSTEGSSKTPERDEMAAAFNDRVTEEPRVPGSEESVLARYIARFRSGRPTSRRERSPPHSGLKDFWWLQESSESPEVQRFRPDSGTPTLLESSRSLEKSPALHVRSLDGSGLSPEDVDVADLQLRAGSLIQRSESSLSSLGHVSSEGLGSSPMSNVSSSECDCSRSRLPLLDAAPVAPVLRAHPTPAPEEDILYQWRLRRKMEQAREGNLPFPTRKHSPSPPVRISKQVLYTDDAADPVYQVSPQGAVQSTCASLQPHIPVPCVPRVALASPSLTPTCDVPPHLRLLCDLLPCPRSQSVPSGPQVKLEVGEVSTLCGHLAQQPHQCKPPPERQRKAEQMEEVWRKSKGDGSWRKREKMEAGQQPPPQSMVGPVPESPVHRAVEQVISERLFSPLPPPKPMPERRERRPSTPSTEDAAAPQPVGIAACLLDDAEDSDGTDFTDDPLLQVLRHQRESLRSRFRVLDSRLAELEK